MEILTKEQKDLLADFLERIRDYERESHNLIGFDERETSEFVEIYEGILRDRNHDSDTESGLHKHSVSGSACDCKAEWLTHKREYDQHPYGDNVEYDECNKCGKRHNFHCF